MEEKFELGSDDVISIENLNLSLTKKSMSRFSEINKVAKNYAGNPLLEWINNEIECEVLQVKGGGWIKGRAKAYILIEFIPDIEKEIIESDEDKSVLDDLREQLSKDVPTH